MNTWHTWPDELLPVDEQGESPYLLVLCDRAVCPLAAYYDSTRNEFYALGCPGADALSGVRGWMYMPRAPRHLFLVNSSTLVKYAEQNDLIEED